MALTGDETLNIVIKLKDEMSAELNKAKSGLENLEPAFKKMAAVGTAAFAGIVAIVGKSIDAYAEVERAQRQLEHAVIDVSKGTAEQVVQIQKVTQALEEKAGVDADALNMGAAQLSTFGLQTKSVISLTKSLADFTVNQNGVNASADQYIDSANTIAKALQGQFGILEKSGIRFTELQQKMILTGTESQKVAALQEGLAQNLRETTDTVGGIDVTMAKFHRTIENVGDGIAKSMLPVFNDLAARLAPLLTKFADWANKNPKLLSTIVLVTGGLAALVAVVGFLGLVLPPVIAGFTLLLGPVGLVIAIIAALIAIIVLIVRHWEDLKQATMDIWNSIVNFFQGVWDTITATISTAWNAILNFFGAIWEGIKALFKFQLDLIVGIVIAVFDAMGIDIVAVFTTIGQFFIDTWQTIKDTFSLALQELALLWNNMWQAISDFIGPIWEGIKNVVMSGWNWLRDKFVAYAEPVSKAWTGLWSALTTGVTIAWESVKQTVKDSINWIIDKVNKVIEAINAVAAKGAGAIGLGGKAPQIPTIPMLANGGIVNKPTLAMIGEAGPEAVVPLSKGRGAMGGFGGGINVTINYPQFNSPGDDSRMKQMLDEYFRPLLINNKMSA